METIEMITITEYIFAILMGLVVLYFVAFFGRWFLDNTLTIKKDLLLVKKFFTWKKGIRLSELEFRYDISLPEEVSLPNRIFSVTSKYEGKWSNRYHAVLSLEGAEHVFKHSMGVGNIICLDRDSGEWVYCNNVAEAEQFYRGHELRRKIINEIEKAGEVVEENLKKE